MWSAFNKSFYAIKPWVPRALQLSLRRALVRAKLQKCKESWPIDEHAAAPPAEWRGWPGKRRFALVLTHDVDTLSGINKCERLMRLEEDHGFRSSFNLVPEKYAMPSALRETLIGRGFEVGVHGLKHDGKLYSSRHVFSERAVKINGYLKEWGAVGFRSPAMHHNLDWIHDLEIEYDMSTFDTDPFEPQSDGMGTIFPFWVRSEARRKSYVELPYTLPQDFTLFVLMREMTITIWQRKLDWIAANGGMALMNTHPDYMDFDGAGGREEYPIRYYTDFLKYLQNSYRDQYWQALPREIAGYWSLSHQKRKMKRTVSDDDPSKQLGESKEGNISHFWDGR